MSKLPSHTEVVIIGGGIAGTSIAYHLAERNVQVTLVERKSLTCGTTWHAAGLVGQLRATKNLTKMAKYSTELYHRLNQKEDLSAGFLINGLVRDREHLVNIEIGILARGSIASKTAKQGLGNKKEFAIFAGVIISSDSWIYVDENGFLVSHDKLKF